MCFHSESEVLEVLPKAAPPQMATLTQQELEKIEHAEESTMRSLRLFLRDVLTRLAQDRRFKVGVIFNLFLLECKIKIFYCFSISVLFG